MFDNGLYRYNFDGADTATHIRDDGWHGIGSKLSENADVEEVAAKAGLDYHVEKRRMSFETAPVIDADTGEIIEPAKMVPTSTYGLVRADTNDYFGPCSEKWQPVQNLAALDAFDRFRQAGDLEYVAGGTFDGGLRAWVMARSKEQRQLFGGQEQFQPHFLFCNTFQSGVSVLLQPKATVVSCLNQVAPVFAGTSKTAIRYRHVGPKQFSANDAQLAIGDMMGNIDAFGDVAEKLGNKQAPRLEVDAYWRRLFKLDDNAGDFKTRDQRINRNQKKIDELLMIANDKMPNSGVRAGTWWQFLQATTYYIDHEAGRSKETRAKSAWFNQGAEQKVRAVNMALEYAQ